MALLQLIIKTLQLSIIRVGIGWMFALLTFNFNRVSITYLGAVAVIVTTFIVLHHFLSPFQVFWGRLADRYPIAGYRRTPYIILSALLGVLGMERRISREEHAALLASEAEEAASRKAARQPGAVGGLLRLPTGMPRKQTAGFFAFVLLAIMGIFLQDTILEVFGGEVFGLSVGETTSFTQV
jgi:hypothetical protein